MWEIFNICFLLKYFSYTRHVKLWQRFWSYLLYIYNQIGGSWMRIFFGNARTKYRHDSYFSGFRCFIAWIIKYRSDLLCSFLRWCLNLLSYLNFWSHSVQSNRLSTNINSQKRVYKTARLNCHVHHHSARRPVANFRRWIVFHIRDSRSVCHDEWYPFSSL